MNLTYKEAYWDEPKLKAEFIRFLINIHNLDLSPWGEKGFWDYKYRPFSYFDGDRLVSSACLYTMNMRVDGRDCLVAQVSGVGTLPEYRRTGLSFDLSMRAINWARATHDFYFLFADEMAKPLYKKCGFRIVDEYKTRITVTGHRPQSGARQLDPKKPEDLKLVHQFACNRTPVSNLLGVKNDELLMFWCMIFLNQIIYHIPELDILVLYERKDDLVTVYDIVGEEIPKFSDIYPFIAEETDRAVDFLFMTDRLGLNHGEELKLSENSATHLCGNFPLESSRFIIPLTAHA